MAVRQRIGILDSGVGGLSVLIEVRRLLPAVDLVYLADSAHCPYGPKPAEQIRARVRELVAELLRRGCELVVIACNSATIAAVEALRATEPVAIVGMEPAVKPAVALTRSGVIGVLATEASLAGEKYHRLMHDHGAVARILTRAAPDFVELVEAGKLDGQEVDAAVATHLGPLLDAGADVLVLGCTHYPFLRPAIQAYADAHALARAGVNAATEVRVIDSGLPVARQVCRQLGLDPAARETAAAACEMASPEPESSAESASAGVTTTAPPGRVELATSGDPELLGRLLPRLCPDLAGVEVAKLGV